LGKFISIRMQLHHAGSQWIWLQLPPHSKLLISLMTRAQFVHAGFYSVSQNLQNLDPDLEEYNGDTLYLSVAVQRSSSSGVIDCCRKCRKRRQRETTGKSKMKGEESSTALLRQC
jgi:hypothetical protein